MLTHCVIVSKLMDRSNSHFSFLAYMEGFLWILTEIGNVTGRLSASQLLLFGLEREELEALPLQLYFP